MKKYRYQILGVIAIALSILAVGYDYPTVPWTFATKEVISSSKTNANNSAINNAMVTGTKKANFGELLIAGKKAITDSRLFYGQQELHVPGQYTTLNAAFTAATTESTVSWNIVIDGLASLTATASVPVNVRRITKRPEGKITGTGQITFTGQYIDSAPNELIFSGVTVTGNITNQEVYPEWWGAIKNDSIVDTTAVQSSIYLGAINKSRTVLSGEYTIDLRIWIPSNTFLESKNRRTGGFKLKDGTSVRDVLRAGRGYDYNAGDLGTNITLKGIYIDGNRVNHAKFSDSSTDYKLTLISFDYTDTVLIDDCELKESLNHAIYTQFSKNITVENCYIHDILMANPLDALFGCNGINLVGGFGNISSNFRAINNTILNVSDIGISFVPDSQTTNRISYDCVVMGNTISTVNAAIAIETGQGTFNDGVSYRTLISNNIINSTGIIKSVGGVTAPAIFTDYQANQTTIANNIINNARYDGILCRGSYNLITSNQIYTVYHTGITVGNGAAYPNVMSTGNVISNNIISGTGVTAVPTSGIGIDASYQHDLEISGNNVRGMINDGTAYEINLRYGTGILLRTRNTSATVRENTIRECYDAGIGISFYSLPASLNVSVLNNSVIDAKYGLYITTAVTNNITALIKGNQFRGTPGHAKYYMDYCFNIWSTIDKRHMVIRDNDVSGYTSAISTGYWTSAPTQGTWKLGETIDNLNPVNGSNKGWVCTVAGTPGTWKRWGDIGRLLETTIEIPTWNMVANATKAITHGITLSKIRDVQVIIQRDDVSAKFPLSLIGPTLAPQGGIVIINTSTLTMERLTGGYFDNSNYDDGTVLRGHVVIRHEE